MFAGRCSHIINKLTKKKERSGPLLRRRLLACCSGALQERHRQRVRARDTFDAGSPELMRIIPASKVGTLLWELEEGCMSNAQLPLEVLVSVLLVQGACVCWTTCMTAHSQSGPFTSTHLPHLTSAPMRRSRQNAPRAVQINLPCTDDGVSV